ncbi:superinfection immunity protein [Mycolicibacterium vulneris]|uniref:superinfection immunity protein n=1 Tax=Mycolicibacterium vulneris TaxID=547163 RepID=UPI0013FDC123|nr:superinfection immunity protein [Mycolicibacterium vulneris]
MSDTKPVSQQADWTPKQIAGYIGIIALALAVGAIVIVAAIRGFFDFSGIGGVFRTIGFVLAGIAGAVASVVVYLLPILIATRRQVQHTGSIIVITLFLGFTYVGWVIALAMAVADKRELSRVHRLP